jgi:hypothetical protein
MEYINMRPLKNYGVWTDDYSKHPQNPEYSGLKTDFFKGLNI